MFDILPGNGRKSGGNPIPAINAEIPVFDGYIVFRGFTMATGAKATLPEVKRESARAFSFSFGANRLLFHGFKRYCPKFLSGAF